MKYFQKFIKLEERHKTKFKFFKKISQFINFVMQFVYISLKNIAYINCMTQFVNILSTLA
jgi:hypothetical protein